MNIGMLWFDNDPKTEISAKIARAVSHYRDKYGITPNLVFVHPSAKNTPGEEEITVYGQNIILRTSPTIRPNHLWVGVDQSIQKEN